MKHRSWKIALFVLLLLCLPAPIVRAEGDLPLTLLGRVVDVYGEPVPQAEVQVKLDGRPVTVLVNGEEREAAVTADDGYFVLELPLSPEMAQRLRGGESKLTLFVNKPTYRTVICSVNGLDLGMAPYRFYVEAPAVVLSHSIGPAFIIASVVFILVFGAISLRLLHETTASLAGAVFLLAVTYLVGTSHPAFYIIDFEQAVHYIDFDVIFLVMGLMIFVAIVGRTGLFQWLAYSSYRLARGRPWPLTVILILVTALTSAFLNNVTVMLLIAPVTVQIALTLGLNPLSLLIPEVMASNIGGAATLIGDPPNTLIGSYANLGFGPFIWNLGPVIVLITLAFIGLTWLRYRKEYHLARGKASVELERRLATDARIRDPVLLRKAGVAALITLALFFVGDYFHMPPSVAALIGAVVLLIWTRPDINEMLAEVDWTTLVFFMALFIVVGALQDTGVIQVVAGAIGHLAGGRLSTAVLLLLWVPAIGSAIVANIPFAAAMLPVAAYLTRTIPGAGNNVLYWALALGTCLGGNATTIGAAANIITVGISDRAGYRITFTEFLKVGVPVTFVILVISTVYLLVRY